MNPRIALAVIQTLADEKNRKKIIYIGAFILFLGILPLGYIMEHPFKFGLSLIKGSGETQNISNEVLRYKPTLEKYASQYGVSEYVPLMLALIQQESSGTSLDVMQSAEGQYNTRYPKIQNGILDPDYSIQCGVQEFRDALKMAGVTGPNDIENISLALQIYNFGTEFFSFAKSRGGYSQAVAKEFSNIWAKKMGWKSYGDSEYVQHVLRYYTVTNNSTASSEFLSKVVEIAMQQQGKPYVWGAEGPNSFDCSGLVAFCYKTAGFNHTRTTAQGYHDMSESIGNPAVGDLIFFRKKGENEDHHIGIYIGNNQMIEAPYTGAFVRVTTYLNRSDFVGYGRLKVK